MRRLLNRLLRDENGATAMEYGLMIALIALALITALTAISGRLTATFDTIRTTLGG
jgi:pilus assembly protein Flp/PilA